MKRLFGTDGVRGTAGVAPLDPPTVARLGAALVRALPRREAAPRVLVGRDTRESGEWIERELARGAAAAGARVTSAGVLPTPGVAHLARQDGFDAGVVISASHNPFQDNGIKVFSGAGAKYGEALETAIEGMVADESWQVSEAVAPVVEPRDLATAYLAHVRLALPDPAPLRGLRLAIDCANGATTPVAPRLFRELGFDTLVLHAAPDGRNINDGCGSTHPESVARAVVPGGCRLGVAFDGDGDRAIFIDSRGRTVDGDAVLFFTAKHLKARGRLPGNAVVATVMSNVGLELGLRDLGIELVRCPVGDKYVAEEMLSRGLGLGGEQSGHIIFADRLFTGDGLITALSVLRVMAETGRELADLAGELTRYPQVLVNVRVRRKADLGGVPAIAAAVERVERRLEGRGRLLVRYSGTEPLLRVMIEGQDQREIHAWAEEIADAVRQHLG